MITIQENTPQKLSGISSLFVTFPFNAEVLQIIKQSDKYYYHQADRAWELPVTSLQYLLDNLTYFDDIQLTLQQTAANKEVCTLTLEHKYPPFQHQIDAILYGLNERNSFLLLDDPGMGKTATMVYLAEELHAQKGLEHCLIICGINTLKANWKREIQKFSTLPCRVLGEKISKKGTVSYKGTKERAAELMQPIGDFFVITNVESLRSDDVIAAIKKSPNRFDMIVLDEAHKCKGVHADQSRGLLKLTSSTHRIALTGTLIINAPLDAYMALKWIGVEHANLGTFKSQYCEFGGFGGHQIVGYKHLDLLKTEIESCSLRRRKADLKDFPPKMIIREIVELSDQHRQFYDNVKNGVREECDKIELNAQNVMALTTRLRQATACPSALTTTPVLSAKIDRAVSLVNEICESGDKVVIMSTFKETVRELAELLKEYQPLLGTGDISDGEVNQNIEKFQSDPSYKVFIGTTAKCGTGITLNAASYLISIDTPWTAALQEQVEDRINRITNKKPVTIYRLICQNTIDEAVEQILNTKQAFSDYIVDNTLTESGIEILRNYITDLA